jgi:methylaspartate mutase sigma subunit
MHNNSNTVSESGLTQSVAEDACKPLKVLLSSVSSDSHTWNLVFMQLLLEEQGHEVLNLGPCASDEFIIEQCIQYQPDMLVISSVNGHGNIDGERLIRQLRHQPELQRLPAVIGGKLGTRGGDNLIYNKTLLDAGFSAVFEDAGGIAQFENFVRAIAGALPHSEA